jgi:predicted RND superfamily exporter protein
MSLPYGLDLTNQINLDKSATRMIVTIKDATAKELRDMDTTAREWLKTHAPELFSYGASLSLMFAHISERNIQSMLGGTFIALALISGLLLIALRSLRIGLISLVPNLIPAAMALGVWGYLVGQVGLSIAVVGSLSLGIVVDDTVHFLSKYLRARRELGVSAEEGVRYAFASVGRALFTTTVILTAGFATLALSGFKLNADTGMLTAIAIAMALVADFFLLPGLLILFDRRKDRSREPIQSSL